MRPFWCFKADGDDEGGRGSYRLGGGSEKYVTDNFSAEQIREKFFCIKFHEHPVSGSATGAVLAQDLLPIIMVIIITV